jgi:hypothetical protein
VSRENAGKFDIFGIFFKELFAFYRHVSISFRFGVMSEIEDITGRTFSEANLA